MRLHLGCQQCNITCKVCRIGGFRLHFFYRRKAGIHTHGHVLSEIFPLCPVIGVAFVIIPNKRKGQHIRDFFHKHIFVEHIRIIVEPVLIVEIHGTARGDKGRFRTCRQGGWIDVVENIPDLPFGIGIVQKITEICSGSVRPDRLDRSTAESIVKPLIVVIFAD